ncbi:MAG TPA: hypothetical protein PLL72_21900, partial [Burkholderiaceae bacterium]|nr:hypothetical protein [Burkholderiaceae bacterium]
VPDGVYDLFGTTNLSASVPGLNLTNWVWLARTNAGETTLTVPLLSGAEGYYVLGTTNDSDGDGLTDAFERLVEPSRYAAGLAAGGRAGQGHRFGWAQVF